MKREAKRTQKENKELKQKLGYVPYDILPILSTNSHYNIIFSERSNGKTFGFLKMALEDYIYEKKTTVYLRRYELDIRGVKGNEIFGGLNADGVIERLTGGIYNRVYVKSRKAFLGKYDEELDKIVYDNEPFVYLYALSQVGHDKGAFIDKLGNIIFDEFIEVGSVGYLVDEFTLFKNALSTFIRYRDDIKIFMLGNTINRFCPYFEWLGLKNAKKQKQGTIETYESTDGVLKTKYAVEYAEPSKSKNGGKGKPSDVFFTFEKSKMVSEGSWEIKEYPILPVRFKKENILFTYFIIFDGYVMQCEIVALDDGNVFTYIHKKTTEIKDDDTDLIFTTSQKHKLNYSKNILKPRNDKEARIAWFFKNDKVFYQSNELGDIVANYLNSCEYFD